MEENYSDTEHIIAGKRNEKFQSRITTLRTLIFILLFFGIGLTIFALITWNNSSNNILRSLAVTGLVTIFASIIGLIGCNRCLKHLEVIKTTKMKESPGQEALLIFFYFNFLLFCAFLLFGTWCFFYQDDATAWLEAKYSDKESWEQDFKGIQLATVQNNIKLILTIAGILSYLVAVNTFTCIIFSLKISMAFETIHTIIQVQDLVIVLISSLIVYAGAIAQGYYNVPQVSESEPEFLPQVLIFTGVAMILVAFLGFFASKAESKIGLISYSIFCAILLVNFLIFTVLLNFGSQSLQNTFEEKCNEVMPFFHKDFFKSFGCMNKYTQNSTDVNYLTCDKEQIGTIWEGNVGIDVEEQSDFYGCLNEKCCIAMISFVKGKFNFLAAFCIVAFFFTLVAIITSQYMYKKIKKFQTRILSHRNDNTLLLFMIAFTVGLGILIYTTIPEGPKGMPQPSKESQKIETDYWSLYDLGIDRSIGIGSINLLGWWNFDRISLFQAERFIDNSIQAEVVIQSFPNNGEFRVLGDYNDTVVINNTAGWIKIQGKISEINQTMTMIEFRPGCVLDKNNYLEFNLTFLKSRILETNETTNETIEYGVPRRYKIDLNLNSGSQRTYRAKLVEENLNSNGPSNYFKELASPSDVNVSISFPFSQKCQPFTVSLDSHGIIEYNMSLLNHSIPYTMRILANRKNYSSIVFDYFVGGYPVSSKVEMGIYSFYTSDVQSHNVTGRLFDAFTNRTFFNDYTLTVYQGYGELNKTNLVPYETLEFTGNGDYYTGFFEMFDLKSSAYVAVVESYGYINNFQRFYALPSPPYTKKMRALPIVPQLKEGELALVLTWGYSPKDLDIHVEFVASPTILCKCDFSMHQCGGVKYMSDTTAGGDRGADVIKFDYTGDYQYIVYVSQFKHRSSPKATNNTQSDVNLPESQAQLKVFAPYYQWPVFVFDVPAAPASSSQNYWTVFCLNGKSGLRNIVPINVLTSAAPDVTTCHGIYGTPSVLQTSSNSTEPEQP